MNRIGYRAIVAVLIWGAIPGSAAWAQVYGQTSNPYGAVASPTASAYQSSISPYAQSSMMQSPYAQSAYGSANGVTPYNAPAYSAAANGIGTTGTGATGLMMPGQMTTGPANGLDPRAQAIANLMAQQQQIGQSNNNSSTTGNVHYIYKGDHSDDPFAAENQPQKVFNNIPAHDY